MKPKFLPLLDRCITDGIERGYARAHKHTDTPNEFVIKDHIYESVMHELYESFDFQEPENVNA
jgi:hypothetical protein